MIVYNRLFDPFFAMGISCESMHIMANFAPKERPILEFGVFEGESTTWLYDIAKQKNVDLHAVDHFYYLKECDKDKFLEGYAKKRLRRIDPQLNNFYFYDTDKTTFDLDALNPGYIHLDTGWHWKDFENIAKMKEQPLVCLGYWDQIPIMTETLVYAILKLGFFPMAITFKKAFLTKDENIYRESIEADFTKIPFDNRIVHPDGLLLEDFFGHKVRHIRPPYQVNGMHYMMSYGPYASMTLDEVVAQGAPEEQFPRNWWKGLL